MAQEYSPSTTAHRIMRLEQAKVRSFSWFQNGRLDNNSHRQLSRKSVCRCQGTEGIREGATRKDSEAESRHHSLRQSSGTI